LRENLGLPIGIEVLHNSRQIYCGHNVFMIGLFDPLQTHTDEVEPVMRFGQVSVPEITIKLALDGNPLELTSAKVCLIETRSWGGESGSPVMVHSEHYVRASEPPGIYHIGEAQKSEVLATQADCTLLGLLHGHFEVERPVEPLRSGETDLVTDMNAGIAAVIPAKIIGEFIMSGDRLVKERESRPKRKVKAPVPDSAPIPETQFTKEDFETALKKASRKIVPKK